MHATARFQVLLAALCFATTGTAQALGPSGSTRVGVGAARILVGGAILVAIALARRTPISGLPKGPVAAAAAGADVSPLGVALAVTAGGAYAVYTLAAKRLLAAGHAPGSVMAVAFATGAGILLPPLALSRPAWLLHTHG